MKINEVRHVTCGNTQAKFGTLDRDAIEELRIGPHRSDGGHFVDDNFGRERVAQHRQQSDSRVIGVAVVGHGHAAFGDQIETDIRARRIIGNKFETSITTSLCLS